MTSILQCPVCREPLLPTATGYQCAAGHGFDAARQGYVNLVLAHKKHSKEPGDDPDMIQSRRRFLDLGHYGKISDGINETIGNALSKQAHPDGCGDERLQALVGRVAKRQRQLRRRRPGAVRRAHPVSRSEGWTSLIADEVSTIAG